MDSTINQDFWDAVPAWAVTTKDGRLTWTEKEPCIYESRAIAEREKGSHEVRAVEILIRKPTNRPAQSTQSNPGGDR